MIGIATWLFFFLISSIGFTAFGSYEPTTIAIFAIIAAKDEIYLNDWIDYHRLIGYDHMYLLDSTLDNHFSNLGINHYNFVTVLRDNARPVKHRFRAFANMMNDTLCTFLAPNDYVLLPHHSTIRELVLDKGVFSLTRLPNYALVSNSDEYFPDLLQRKATLRTQYPVSSRYSALLSDIESFDADLVPLYKDNRTIDREVTPVAGVFSYSLLSRTETRWYVEWLCQYFPIRMVTVMGAFDSIDYTTVCEAYHRYSAKGRMEPSNSRWMEAFNENYNRMRRDYETIGLMEDTILWEITQNLLKTKENRRIPVSEKFPRFTEEKMYSDLFLTPSDQGDPEMKLGSFSFTPLQPGEEVGEMVVYGDRDVPLQLVHFCLDHTLAHCFELANYAVDAFENELAVHPMMLKGTNVANKIDWEYFEALLFYYDAVLFNRNRTSALAAQVRRIHNISHHCHPEECYRGWRAGETMLLVPSSEPASPVLPSFLMYVLYHDDESLQMMNDALFEGDAEANGNGLIVPVRVDGGVFFEYIAYRDVFPFRYLREWKDLPYVGISTYKTVVKYATLCTYEVQRLLRIASVKEYDVIPLVQSDDELLESSMTKHRRSFRYAWDALLQSLGYSLSTIRKYDRIKVFCRNSMLIKPQWLLRLSQFMTRAIEAIQFDAALYELCSAEAGYETSKEEVSLRIFNTTTYQMFPFLLERLPSFFLTVEGANICQGNEDCPYESFW